MPRHEAVKGKPHTVYAIQCRVTKRLYVGCSCNPHARISAHFDQLRRGEKLEKTSSGYVPSIWQEDYNKYGSHAFDVFFIEEGVVYDARRERENFYIRKYRADERTHGYNKRPEISAKHAFCARRGKPSMGNYERQDPHNHP